MNPVHISSVIRHFKHSDAVKISNGIIPDPHTGPSHMHVLVQWHCSHNNARNHCLQTISVCGMIREETTHRRKGRWTVSSCSVWSQSWWTYKQQSSAIQVYKYVTTPWAISLVSQARLSQGQSMRSLSFHAAPSAVRRLTKCELTYLECGLKK